MSVCVVTLKLHTYVCEPEMECGPLVGTKNGGSTTSPVVWSYRVTLSCPLCRVTLSNTLGSGPLRGEATAPFDQDHWMK